MKYRYESERLFQPTPRSEEPNPLPNGAPFKWNNYGATAVYVDKTGGWKWDNVGGDYLDANSVQQGTTPWATKPLNVVSGSTATYDYSVDVTEAVKNVQERNTWNAFLLKNTGGVRNIAGARHTNPPSLTVGYVDGDFSVLGCTYSTNVTTSSVFVGSASSTHQLPCFLEFEKPAKEVSSATLSFTITAHFSGSATMSVFVLDPPVNTHPVEGGLAESGYPLDLGIDHKPSIIGVHRYLDTAERSDFISDCGLNIYKESDYDPAIWDRGPTDTTKLPHRDLGKFIAAGPQFELVKSDYVGEGFTPLAEGLGALKVTMPKDPTVAPGSIVGYGGTTGSIAKIFLPEEDFGRLKRLFIRYYMMFGTPLDNSFANKHPVYNVAGGTPVWTDMGGKTGITPSHDNTYGGYSGSSGGGYGWQMRLAWSDRPTELGEPSGNATTMGVHTYDFGLNNPVGHRYMDGSRDDSFGSEGGLGGVFYPGQWYCIEHEIDLNTVMTEAPGYVADGANRIWIDGRLALNMENMVMRSLPLVNKAYNGQYLRPCRELGVRDLNFNWFHGGKTLNTIDRTIFVTGLAWGREYIGPMVLPPPLTPEEQKDKDIDDLILMVDSLKAFAETVAPTDPYWDTWDVYQEMLDNIKERNQ